MNLGAVSILPVDQEAGARALRGELEQLNLLDVLQMYRYGPSAIEIRVAGEVSGRIVLRGGDIVHAQAEDERGFEALRRLLRVTRGVLRARAFENAVERTIQGDFEAVVLEALRQLDEENRHDAPSPAARPRLHQPPAQEPKCQQALAELAQLDGFLGACLVEVWTGRLLSYHLGRGGYDRGADPEVAALLVSPNLVALAGLDFAAAEDFLITLQDRYHLMRNLPRHPGRVLYLVLDKATSNLAMGRLQLAAAEGRLAS